MSAESYSSSSSEEQHEIPQLPKKSIPLDPSDGPSSLEIKSDRIDQEKLKIREEALLEMEEAQEDQYKWVPPTEEDLEKEKTMGVEMKLVQERMTQNVQVLSDFKRLQVQGIPRSHYLKVLKSDAAYYYGYLPYLIEMFFQIFPPAEAIEFLESNGSPRPITIRVNTLKSRKKDLKSTLNQRGVNLEDIEWCPTGLQVFESSVPIGATPEYLAGHYMIQSASSWTPVMALDPKPNEKVLDMAAAPGGKTTHIAALMKNTGQLIANDLNPERLKSLTANLHRMGVTNSLVTNFDGANIVEHFDNYFDRVLLDAPCTGLGVVSKDPSVKVKRNAEDVEKLAYEQKKLILAAIDAIDHNSPTGGYLVYSTCSISTEENEAVVDYALKKRGVKLVDTGLPFGKPGIMKCKGRSLNTAIKLTRRYYPHVYNMDGFFVAKFKKYSNWKEGMPTDNKKTDGQPEGNSEQKSKKDKNKKRKSKPQQKSSPKGTAPRPNKKRQQSNETPKTLNKKKKQN